MSENHPQSPKSPSGGWDLPFESMVEQINDGILVVEMNGEIIYANPSMADMIGYSRQQMVGAELFDFMDEEWTARAKANLRRREEGVAEMFDHQWQHRDGSGVWTLVSAKPMKDEDGVQWGSLVAIQEISERKRMEEKIRRARDELEARVRERTRELREANERLQTEVQERTEAERRAREASRAKSAFLANMSHELRTPLNAVIGYSELVQEELAMGRDDPSSLPIDAIEQDLNKVHGAGAHLLELINDILDLTKIEAGKMSFRREFFAFDELVDEVVDTVIPRASENGNQVVAEHGWDGLFNGDRTRLKQVLLNLTGNAAKFTENGTITVRTEETTVGGQEAVRVEVIDTGIGIADEQIERLFEPFTQADESTTREYGGTGLGLTICKRFVEMMDGTIDVDSTPGEGTTFVVEIPSAQPSGLDSETSEVVLTDIDDDDDEIDRQRPSVLIIDDEPYAHDLMKRFLEPHGFQIFSALNAETGLEMAADREPDVIALDVMMPGTDGWSVLSTLKADSELASIPVVMVTMVNDENIGHALGASDYLVKPVDRDQLVSVMSRFDPEQEADDSDTAPSSQRGGSESE